jgi:hypothetical protein
LVVALCSRYVSQEEARRRGLATVEDGSFILRADDTKLPRSAPEGMDATRSASCRTTGMTRMSQCESIVDVDFRVGSNRDVGR